VLLSLDIEELIKTPFSDKKGSFVFLRSMGENSCLGSITEVLKVSKSLAAAAKIWRLQKFRHLHSSMCGVHVCTHWLYAKRECEPTNQPFFFPSSKNITTHLEGVPSMMPSKKRSDKN
jgi:hypothetical protein